MMSTVWKFFRRRLLVLTPEQTSFARRGFQGATEPMREGLERAGGAFFEGYNLAVECGLPELIEPELNGIDLELRGFAFEGAAMGFSFLDWLTPWRRDRISRFLRGAGNAHAYMVHVGVGWSWARLPLNVRRARSRLDPVLGWLAFDGWGFHEGFFHWRKFVGGKFRPKRLTGYELRAFDQGLGRSLWFVNGGNVRLIAHTISNFTAERQPDLWSGIGLAATYAGILDESALCALREQAGHHWHHLALGAAFAAKARQRAGNLTGYTDLAAGILCGLSATDAAHLSDATLENLPVDAVDPAYEVWRQRLQVYFQNQHRNRQLGLPQGI
jgi:enediyne biosynthesis protein E3